jgi:hypothetical protein
MMFEKGQIVKFKDAGGTAKVSRIEGYTVYVFDDFGFENVHDARELLPVVEWQVGAVERKDKPRRIVQPSAQQVDRLLVDLHSHELLDTTHGMTKYEILNLQMDKARAVISEAKRRKVGKVLIIHGKGSGRLKDEVHHMLERMSGLNYYFADFSEGGYGATEVQILNSKH